MLSTFLRGEQDKREKERRKKAGESVETMLRCGERINGRRKKRAPRERNEEGGAVLHGAIHPWYFVYTLVYPSSPWLIFDEEIPSLRYSHYHAP